MNKPIEPRSPTAPAREAEQAQKGGAAYKTNQGPQKQDAPQAAKDERAQQKLAQGEKAAGQEPKKS